MEGKPGCPEPHWRWTGVGLNFLPLNDSFKVPGRDGGPSTKRKQLGGTIDMAGIIRRS
jgi:hypothetical protein